MISVKSSNNSVTFQKISQAAEHADYVQSSDRHEIQTTAHLDSEMSYRGIRNLPNYIILVLTTSNCHAYKERGLVSSSNTPVSTPVIGLFALLPNSSHSKRQIPSHSLVVARRQWPRTRRERSSLTTPSHTPQEVVEDQ